MRILATISEALNRRSAWQIFGSYVLGAWLVLQLAETLSSLLGLPLWFGSGVVALLAAGVPVVLLTTFVQGRRSASREPMDEAEASVATRFFTWRNTFLAGAGVVTFFLAGTGGYLGLRQFGIGPFGTLQAMGVIDFEERLILSEFDNRTADPTIGETVTALFRIDLSQSSAITLLERSQIAPVLARMELPPDASITLEVAMEAALREGLKAVVAGEVLPLGAGFVISARLVAVSDGSALIAERVTAPAVADIPSAVDKLSARLRERIGESLRTIQGDPPLEQVTTASMQALRGYAQASRIYDTGDYLRAILRLEEVLAEDSLFAMAHRQLGIWLTNGREEDRAIEAFTRAYERRDRLTERERYLAVAAYHGYVSLDQLAAIGAYRNLLDRYPTDGVALNNLAILLQQAGQPAEAEQLLRRAIEQRTAIPTTYSMAMNLQGRLGMHDGVEQTHRQLKQRFPDHPVVARIGAALAMARLDHDAAEQLLSGLLEASRGNPVWESVALFDLGSVKLTRGRIVEGNELFLRGYDVSTEVGSEFVTEPRELFQARNEASAALLLLDDPARALAILDRAIASAAWDSDAPGTRDRLGLAQLFAEAGRPERARRLVSEADSEVGSTPVVDVQSQPSRVLAVAGIAMAERRHDDAIAEYRKMESSTSCTLCGVHALGRAYAHADQPDSAIAVYGRYVTSRALFRWGADATDLWRTLLALGSLYESRGEGEQAIQMYARFIELWADADPPLQRRVGEARASIERLTSDASLPRLDT